MIKKIVRKLTYKFYFYSDNSPKQCTHCNSSKIDSTVTEWLDVGFGNCGPTSEEEYYCKKCNNIVGYWAYGYFDPCFMMDYLMIDN